MKNILIIANGDTANVFLKRISNTDLTKKKYYVVYYEDKTLPEYRMSASS